MWLVELNIAGFRIRRRVDRRRHLFTPDPRLLMPREFPIRPTRVA